MVRWRCWFRGGGDSPGSLPFTASCCARRAPAASATRRSRCPFGLGDRGRRRGDCRGLRQESVGKRSGRSCGRGRTPSSPPAGCGCRGCFGGGLMVLALARHLASHLGADLAFGAQRSIGGMQVDPPHHDRRRRTADGRPLLGQRPAGVQRLAGVDWPGKLPVEPGPLLDGGYGHVDRPEADGHRHEQGWRRHAGLSGPGFDRKGGEIARQPGKQRDF